MASDGPSPHSPSLRFGLIAPQPLRRHHAQFLLDSTFHDPRMSNVLESHRERATCSRLSLRPCTAPLNCGLQTILKLSLLSLDHLCSNLSQSCHSCWITVIRFGGPSEDCASPNSAYPMLHWHCTSHLAYFHRDLESSWVTYAYSLWGIWAFEG